MKRFSIIIFTSLLLSFTTVIFGQTTISIGCLVGDHITRTKEITYFILSHSDTLYRYRATDLTIKKRLYDTVAIDGIGTYKLLFQQFDGDKRKQVEYDFAIDGRETLVQIFLYFSTNSAQTDYLKDLTISKFYSLNTVKLVESWDKRIGGRPLYKIVSNSDTTFYGVSETSQFYGKMLFRKEAFWMVNSGSYCSSTTDERPLTKGNWVYSFVPGFSESKQYRIEEKGEYKYIVTLGMQKYSNQFADGQSESGETRKRTLILFEIEDRFFVM